MALNFDKFAAKGNEFLNKLAVELGCPGDKEKAGRILRAVLHVLRDRLTLEESVQLMAQLPMFLKAVYVEGWAPQKPKKKIRHIPEFIEEVRKVDHPLGNVDFKTDEEAEKAIITVFRCLKQYVSEGELEDVAAELPRDLKVLVGHVIPVEDLKKHEAI